MGLRLLVSAAITPPRALDGRNTNYFAKTTALKVNKVMAKENQEVPKRIRARLEAEQFGHGKYGHIGTGEHQERAASKIESVAPLLQTTVKAKEKGTGLKIYLTNPSMPWPLITNWPIGVPGSGLKSRPFVIKPRKDRQATGKSRKKRLVFFWVNEGKEFWGPMVRHPGFGSHDVLTEELTALQQRLPAEAREAVYQSVVEWTAGGGRQKPSLTRARR